MPQIVMRKDYHKEHMGNRTDLDFVFGTEHFVKSPGVLCPKMQMLRTSDEVLQVKHFYGPLPLAPETISKTTDRRDFPIRMARSLQELGILIH